MKSQYLYLIFWGRTFLNKSLHFKLLKVYLEKKRESKLKAGQCKQHIFLLNMLVLGQDQVTRSSCSNKGIAEIQPTQSIHNPNKKGKKKKKQAQL